MTCVVGAWIASLDDEDRLALGGAMEAMSRADLFGTICAAEGCRPFGLTALKNHINQRCVCD